MSTVCPGSTAASNVSRPKRYANLHFLSPFDKTQELKVVALDKQIKLIGDSELVNDFKPRARPGKIAHNAIDYCPMIERNLACFQYAVALIFSTLFHAKKPRRGSDIRGGSAGSCELISLRFASYELKLTRR